MYLEDRFFDQEFIQEMGNDDFRMLLYLLHFASKKTGIVELNMRMLNFSANTGRQYSVDDVLERFGRMLCLIPGRKTTAIFPSYISMNWMKNGIPNNVNSHPLYKSIVKELASFGLTLEDVNILASNIKKGKQEDDSISDRLIHIPVCDDGNHCNIHDRTNSDSILHRAVDRRLEKVCETTHVEKKDGESSSAEVIDYDGLFAEFWKAYPAECPRKVDRKKCRDKFVKILKVTKDPNATFKSIMEGLSVWKVCDTWTSDGGQYIRAPLVWLNGQCWNDRPSKGATKQNGNVNRKAVSANANVVSDDTEGLF